MEVLLPANVASLYAVKPGEAALTPPLVAPLPKKCEPCTVKLKSPEPQMMVISIAALLIDTGIPKLTRFLRV